MDSTAPSFTTDRLLFRGHRRSDFADSLAMWSNPDVTRHIGGRPSTEEEAWARLLRYVGHWALMGFGYWLVCERSNGRFVGEVGLADHKRDLTPSLEGAPEMGWALTPRAHGQGFATEAVRAALAWAEATRGFRRTVCLIDPDNAPSRRVAAKVGYRALTAARYKGEPTLLFERQA